MAKKKSNKSISTLVAKLKEQDSLIDNFKKENQKLSAEGSNLRISKLETDLTSLTNILVSMTEVNKILVGRLTKTSDKDPGVVTVKPNLTQPVHRGDTTTDILAKLYSFFVKTKEDETRKQELERDFAQEKINEAKRRKPKQTATKVQSVARPSSNPITSLLGMIYDGVKGLVSFITGGLVGVIGGGLSSLKDGVSAIFSKIPGGGVLNSIMDSVSSLFSFVSKLAVGLGTFVVSVIESSAGLIMRILTPAIVQLIKSAFSLAGIGIGSLGRLGASILSNPLGAAGAAGLSAYIGMKYGLYGGGEEKLQFGEEAFRLKQRKKQLQNELSRSTGTGIDPSRDEDRRKEIAEIDAKLPAAYQKYLNETVIPAMQDQGYNVVPNLYAPGGDPNVPYVGFERVNPDSGQTEQVMYRKNANLSDITKSPKEYVSIRDQAIIEGSILKQKGGQELEKGLTDASNKMGDYTQKAESKAKSYAESLGYSDLKRKISSMDTASSSERSESDSTKQTTTTTTPPPSPPQRTMLPSIREDNGVNNIEPSVIIQPTQTSTTTSTQAEGGSAEIRNRNPFINRAIQEAFMH